MARLTRHGAVLRDIAALRQRINDFDGEDAARLRAALEASQDAWRERLPRSHNDFVKARARDLRTGVVVRLTSGHDYDVPEGEIRIRSYHGPNARRTEVTTSDGSIMLMDIRWLLVHREDRRGDA